MDIQLEKYLCFDVAEIVQEYLYPPWKHYQVIAELDTYGRLFDLYVSNASIWWQNIYTAPQYLLQSIRSNYFRKKYYAIYYQSDTD